MAIIPPGIGHDVVEMSEGRQKHSRPLKGPSRLRLSILALPAHSILAWARVKVGGTRELYGQGPSFRE